MYASLNIDSGTSLVPVFDILRSFYRIKFKTNVGVQCRIVHITAIAKLVTTAHLQIEFQL